VARAGDPATVRVYRGVIDTIEVRGLTAETPQNPNRGLKHASAFEVVAIGLLLLSLAMYMGERVPWFARSADVYAGWAVFSGGLLTIFVGEDRCRSTCRESPLRSSCAY
jgi:hypothetical protein